MDAVRRVRRPQLHQPRGLVAFEGWNDASEAASSAITFIHDQVEATPFATLEPEEFYDFQVTRPHVEIDGGGTRRLSWPATTFCDIDLPGDHDLVTVTGHEPNLRWKTYTRLVAQTLSEADVDLVVTLGAFIGQVAHTGPVPLIGVATDPDLLDAHGLASSVYEGPTGIIGVSLEAFREVGIPAVSIWGAAPHYLAANTNPKVALALLSKAASVLSVDLSLDELERTAAEFEERVDAALADSDEFSEYVEKLQADHDALDPSQTKGLISEIETFLRERER